MLLRRNPPPKRQILQHKIKLGGNTKSSWVTKQETTMRTNATLLFFAFFLIVGSLLKIDVAEDDLFWATELQDRSMSVAPPPTTPPATPEECLVEVSSPFTSTIQFG
jgi:hypothetical protein